MDKKSGKRTEGNEYQSKSEKVGANPKKGFLEER